MAIKWRKEVIKFQPSWSAVWWNSVLSCYGAPDSLLYACLEALWKNWQWKWLESCLISENQLHELALVELESWSNSSNQMMNLAQNSSMIMNLQRNLVFVWRIFSFDVRENWEGTWIWDLKLWFSANSVMIRLLYHVLITMLIPICLG